VAQATGIDAGIKLNQISGCRRFSSQGFPGHHLGKARGGKVRVRADKSASTRFPPARPCIRNVGRPENDNNSNDKIDGVRRQQAILVDKVLAEGKELGKLYVFFSRLVI
jgi:hypothetical protein